jgi:hypothetical protein
VWASVATDKQSHQQEAVEKSAAFFVFTPPHKSNPLARVLIARLFLLVEVTDMAAATWDVPVAITTTVGEEVAITVGGNR